MKMQPTISVIVPAYNEGEFLGDCLACLKKQAFRKPFEIIVVDNGSTDQTSLIAKQFGVRLIKENKKGVVFALKTGVSAAKGEIIAFTDADCKPPANWLDQIYKQFQRNSKLDALGGVFSFYDGTKMLDFFAWATLPLNWHLSGGNMAVKKASLKKFGGLREDVNFGFDTELTLRIQRCGMLKIDHQNLMPTSARRFVHNLPKTLFLALTNDLCLSLFGTPLFFKFSDIRNDTLAANKRFWINIRKAALLSAGIAVLTITVFSFFPQSIKAKAPLYRNVVRFTKNNIKAPYQTISNRVEQKMKANQALTKSLEKYYSLLAPEAGSEK